MADGIKEIADYYGLDNQMEQLVEECSELIQAVQKYKRAMANHNEGGVILAINNMQKERADVEIMLEQMRYLNRDAKSMNLYVKEKIERQLNRIEREKANVPF